MATKATKVTKEDLMKPVTNYSRAKRLARAVLGADATSMSMFFLKDVPEDISADDLLVLAGPELRALHSLDRRQQEAAQPVRDRAALPGVRERFDRKLVLTRKERAAHRRLNNIPAPVPYRNPEPKLAEELAE